jgi:hypothetical protein
MDVLTIDVGATYVKILSRRQKERREFERGLTPKLKHDSFTNSLIRRNRKI